MYKNIHRFKKCLRWCVEKNNFLNNRKICNVQPHSDTIIKVYMRKQYSSKALFKAVQ